VVGSGIGMKGFGRLCSAIFAVLIALVVGPAAASAQAPSVAITEPAAGAVEAQPTTTIAGSTSDTTLDPVTLSIYEGVGTLGTLVQEKPAVLLGSEWGVQSSSLANGTYTAVAQQTDSGTLETGVSQEVTFTVAVDTTPPILSFVQTPTPSKDTTPTLAWMAGTADGDLSLVRLKLLNGKHETVREGASTDGEWTIPAAEALEDGTYTAQIEQSDEAGNTATASESFTVDTTPPVLSFAQQTPALSKDTTPTFVWTAGTADSDLPQVRIKLINVGHETVREGAFTAGTWTIPAAEALEDGTYTAQIEQSDEAGNTVTASETFTVDTTPPVLFFTQPIPTLSKDTTPMFRWTAGTADGDLSQVRIKLTNGKTAREAVSTDGEWDIPAEKPLEDGTYTAQIQQSDEAGNTANATETFTVDDTPPAVSIASPINGAHLKDAKPNFTGSAGTLGGASKDGAEVTLKIYPGTSTTGAHETLLPIPHNAGGGWSESNGPHLSDGTYTVQALQEDEAGNVGEVEHTFTIETNTPHVTLNPLLTYTNDATPSFAGSVDTTKGVVESVTLQVFRGSSVAGSAEPAEPPVVVSGNGSTWSTGATGHLPDGTYTAQATQENLAGTAGFSKGTTFTIDTRAPTPTLTAPEASSGLETVSGVAGSAPGDRQQITAELFRGTTVEAGGAYETITVKPGEPVHRWSAAFAELPEGQYTVLARQSDEAGNAGASEPRGFTVTVPSPPPPPAPAPSPSPPTASFTWVPAAPTVGQSVSFVSKSTDPSSALTGFSWDLSGNGALAAGGPVATATFTTAGVHTVHLLVSDANGLSNEVAETVNVGAQALRLMQPFPIVRIAGSETSFGARVKLLTVQAPTAATVTVSCKGRGCKTRSESRIATASSKTRSVAGTIMLSFPRFQRALQAGAVLQIRVSKKGEIGKFTSFTIRRRKLPLRVDACLRPPSTGPSGCPSQ
jgi:hypothetical protein